MPIINRPLKWAGIGTAVGVGVAAILLPLIEIRPFPVAVNSFLERITFKLCPLLILGFSNEAKSMASVILVTIFGNAVLYGLLFGLVAGGVSTFRKGIA
jgi:hypothetical protein